MAVLKLKNVTKIYDNGFEAVHDFNLEIADGEFIVLVGPSGCGKSTTLRMIAGLEEISKGEFYIDDTLVNNLSPKDRGIAMVFQSYALYPQMTVYQNLAFGLTLEGLDEDVIDQSVQETARILGLTPLLERLPRALSGGQRQRVALGRAIIRKAKVFLMDEPLSNLDAKQRVTMRAEIIRIQRNVKATTVYVTHDQTEAMTMADRIVVMKDGYVQQIGTPHDLYFNPKNLFVAGFIGEPPMNFIRCTQNQGKIKINEEEIDISNGVPKAMSDFDGKEIIMGFRPESIELCVDKSCDEAVTFSGKVEVTELLGDYVNIYVNMGDIKCILKVAPHEEPKMGQTIYFRIKYENLFFFDVATENRIK